MSQPAITCVMLVHEGRAEMARQAMDCFEAQTFRDAELLILDTGNKPLTLIGDRMTLFTASRGPRVGALRNMANHRANGRVIAHWDSDDWYHPERLTEQFEALNDSQAQCVGYNRVPFWRGPYEHESTSAYAMNRDTRIEEPPEAWLYSGPSNRPVGASLMYWKSVWGQNGFKGELPAPRSTGEDVDFVRRVEATSFTHGNVIEPRMIARIHPGNTSMTYSEDMERSSSWRRAPEYDDYCRERMR